MRKLFFTLAFVFVASFGFADTKEGYSVEKTEKEIIIKINKVESPSNDKEVILNKKEVALNNNYTLIKYYDEFGCYHYYIIIDKFRGYTVAEGKYWNSKCTDDMEMSMYWR